jgi:hypothetical protein
MEFAVYAALSPHKGFAGLGRFWLDTAPPWLRGTTRYPLRHDAQAVGVLA